MKRINTISIACAWFVITNVAAQNYSVLGTDTQGDCLCNCSDLKTLSYAFDVAMDSAWFKLETFKPRPTDYNYTLSIDYDLSQNNGASITFSTSTKQCIGITNFNMKSDQIIVVNPALNFMEYFSYNLHQINTNVDVKFEDNYTTVVRVKLSDVDKDKNGVINVIGSVGESGTYNVQDVIPDIGYYTTSGTSSTSESDMESKVKVIFIGNTLIVQGDSPSASYEFKLYDLTGKLVKKAQVKASEDKLMFNELNPGIYIYKLLSDEGRFITGKQFIN